MAVKADEMLIIQLAELLAEKNTTSVSITNSLEMICKGFSFDSGIVYEINQYGQFNLRERWDKVACNYRDSFTIDILSAECRRYLQENTLFYIGDKEKNGQFEEELLKLIGMNSGVVLPVVDQEDQVNGLIIFANITDKAELIATERKRSLAVLLSILGRYVGIRMFENKLTFAQYTLESILDNTGIDIYVNDFNTHEILYVNESMAVPYGGKEKFIGQECWRVLFPGQSGPCEFCPQKNLVDDEGNPTKVYTWDYERAFDGSWFRVFSAAFRWVDGRLAHVVSSADITDNKKNEELIRYLANYDSLTNLPNRRMLIADCENRIDKAIENEQGYLLFFDIDGFKEINDSLGHDAGDEFLIQLGKFFTKIPLLKDSIYRNGGDEFVGIIGGIDVSKENIRSLSHFIHQRFEKPWSLSKGDVFTNISLGVACFPEDGTNAEQLLQKADQAMYRAKRNGGGKVCFGYELEE